MLIDRRREIDDIFRPLLDMQRTMDRLFHEIFRDYAREEPMFSSEFYPAVDIYETKDAINIDVELPGMDKKDVKVKIENNVLTISGEKKSEREEKGRNYRVVERSFGRFERSFIIPDTVDTKNVKAKFEKGILKITLPKKEEAKKKVLDVEIEEA